MKTLTHSLLWLCFLLAMTRGPVLAQTESDLKGPLIEKIDWEDKPVSEAAAELVDFVVAKDKNSPWRSVKIRRDGIHLQRVTMHLRNVRASEAFQAIAECTLARMMIKNGIVEFSYPGLKSDRVNEFGIQIRVIIAPVQAASRLGLTAANARQLFERFGVKFTREGSKLSYFEETRELLLMAPPEECDLVAALILLATRTDIDVRLK